MLRAGKKKRNSEAQGWGDRAAGRALPERLGKSPAELHPLQRGGMDQNFHRNRSSGLHVGCAAQHAIPGEKIPQKHLKYLH